MSALSPRLFDILLCLTILQPVLHGAARVEIWKYQPDITSALLKSFRDLRFDENKIQTPHPTHQACWSLSLSHATIFPFMPLLISTRAFSCTARRTHRVKTDGGVRMKSSMTTRFTLHLNPQLIKVQALHFSSSVSSCFTHRWGFYAETQSGKQSVTSPMWGEAVETFVHWDNLYFHFSSKTSVDKGAEFSIIPTCRSDFQYTPSSHLMYLQYYCATRSLNCVG